jgi:hypothetical protein
MTTTQHTAAPWNYDGEFIVNSDGYPIAHVLQGVQSMPKEANARLICAAPDSNKANLLFIQWVDSGERGFPDADKLDAAVKAARAAIAKAKGGAA